MDDKAQRKNTAGFLKMATTDSSSRALLLIITTLLVFLQVNGHASESTDILNDWSFLGNGPSILGTSYNESSYYTAKLPQTWAEAWKACNDTFGIEGSPVNIETDAELDHLIRLITERVDDKEFTNFWTGAKFLDKYLWDGDEELGDFVPWAENEPSEYTIRSRLYMKISEEEEPTWEMYATSDAAKHGFICEVAPRNESEPPPNDDNNDLIILLESSYRVESNFKKTLEDIVLQAAAAWMGWSYPRVAFIVNPTDGGSSTCGTTMIFDLSNTLSDFDRAKEILNTQFTNVTTSQSYCALEAASQEFNAHPTLGTTSVVLLTSGKYLNPIKVAEAAQALKDKCARVFVMGIMDGISMKDLEGVASNTAFVSTSMDFPWLKDKLEQKGDPAC